MASQRDGDASMHGGQLFAGHFLSEGIKKTGAYGKITDGEVGAFVKKAKECRDALVNKEGGLVADITEAQTANDMIFPVLRELEWEIAYEQKTSTTDRPDAILHAQKDGKGMEVILENKNRGVNLDKRNGREAAPSSQMLRYLSNALNAEWGILTNGELWRLYYRRANSKSEQFLELDLGRILSAGNGDKDTLGAHPHWARVFMLMFGRDSYMPGNVFPDLARDESREWEQEITRKLSEKIFDNVFPQLARAFAGKNPDAKRLRDARDAAMITLFRLLFVLYAEDRSLLPVGQKSYTAYELRRARRDLRELEDENFAATGGEKHRLFNKTCEFIDKGEASINFPPYNGGLFDSSRAKLITENPLSDRDFMSALRALSYDGEKWINYRDFSVQHLGAMYERFLEQELYVSGNGAGQVSARPNKYARKSGGSYYTPEELVYLVIDGAVGELLRGFKDKFEAAVKKKAPKKKLQELDPAARALEIKVCDPAMGSGHFLVSLVDYLADWVLAETVEAEKRGSHSPVLVEIEDIRADIKEQARKNKWQVEDRHLEDRQIVRRLVLKRVVHGVDKNPMAVELAKLSLWLHTFTVGAPLTFLDHHLRCGDSLFGEFTGNALTAIEETGSPLLVGDVLKEAQSAADEMREIESVTDSVITQVQSSQYAFNIMAGKVANYDRMMSLWHCRHWLGGNKKEHSGALAAMEAVLKNQTPKGGAAEFVKRADDVINRENFIHWESAFPGVWSDWKQREGGFDAVIGNPPWNVMKMQEAEWFASRMPSINEAATQAERDKRIATLRKKGGAIIAEYDDVAQQANTALMVARNCGAYPFLSGGDINLYSIFVERALDLIKPEGMAGLLTPSGIFADKPAQEFFRAVTNAGRVSKVIDFINRKHKYFADVHASFKFCAFVVGGAERKFKEGEFAFFVNDRADIENRRIVFAKGDIDAINPNTGAMPLFKSQRDANITVGIHRRLPILHKENEEPAHAVKFATLFHASDDSDKFIELDKLKKDGYYCEEPNNLKRGDDLCLPLYVGRMVDFYSHRANSVRVNIDNPLRQKVSEPTTEEQLSNPDFCATPHHWVNNAHITLDERITWMLGFRRIASATNKRTMIASLLPRVACDDSLALLLPNLPPPPKKPTKTQLKKWQEECTRVIAEYQRTAPLLAANISSFALDYVARQKMPGTNLNWHIVRQLPIIPLSAYEADAGGESIGDFVRRRVLELSYTAHDMKPFAADMGYEGEPFAWDEKERAHKRAQLDALYFMLYGISAEELEYIMDSFPIVARQDEKEHGGYYTKDLISEYYRIYNSADWQHRATVSPY